MGISLLIINTSKAIENKHYLVKSDLHLDIERLAIRPLDNAEQGLIQGYWAIDNLGNISIDMDIHTKIVAFCDRCLTQTDINIDTTLKTKLSKQDYQENSYKIDLSNAIYEQLLLCMPTRVLCSQDCKGLCPECGINKNISGCDCESKLKAQKSSNKILED